MNDYLLSTVVFFYIKMWLLLAKKQLLDKKKKTLILYVKTFQFICRTINEKMLYLHVEDLERDIRV